MKIISVNNELVEVMWVDDNEIELIPVDEFISKYGQAKIDEYNIRMDREIELQFEYMSGSYDE
jgi:hypothetical protein